MPTITSPTSSGAALLPAFALAAGVPAPTTCTCAPPPGAFFNCKLAQVTAPIVLVAESRTGHLRAVNCRARIRQRHEHPVIARPCRANRASRTRVARSSAATAGNRTGWQRAAQASAVRLGDLFSHRHAVGIRLFGDPLPSAAAPATGAGGLAGGNTKRFNNSITPSADQQKGNKSSLIQREKPLFLIDQIRCRVVTLKCEHRMNIVDSCSPKVGFDC